MQPVVLVVDDEPAARYGIRRALEKEGYALAEADSIASAEAAVDSRNPGVVLLDVKLGAES
ncbi:MAG TPA: response regulator, partial [Blastocatellia bacterium]|nr:response regulator [Blastocatellia bacterium]